jgi:hypothetical protein
MTQIKAEVIADSVNASGDRITTMCLTYPRFIHAEFMTHRVFSRNASSSRAIPLRTMMRTVALDPAEPIHWGQNEKGMQAYGEVKGWRKTGARAVWRIHRVMSLAAVWWLNFFDVHKQVGNRLLEAHMHIRVVVTATDWANFLALRKHYAAEPTIQELARAIAYELEVSVPVLRGAGEWHLPYISDTDREKLSSLDQRKVSAARCARTSYRTSDARLSKLADDLALYDRLVGSAPIHASPTEHQAIAAPADKLQVLGYSSFYWGNFRGWVQARKLIPGECASEKAYVPDYEFPRDKVPVIDAH